MNRSIFARWPLHRGRGRLSQEAGAALFQGIRIRLTLWYCAVLAVALVLSGVVLYFGAQHFLLTSIEDDVQMHANRDASQFLFSPEHACTPDGPPIGPSFPDQGQGQPISEIVACFNQNGTLIPIGNTTSLPSAFLSNTLAKRALQTGQPAYDTVNTGGTFGQTYRYAIAIRNPGGNGYIAVVMVGESIQGPIDVLSLLLKLLLAIGGLALLGAGVGGLFLSNRALAPARLAWTNQQRFIADAAHELRTPLTLLRADAEVLLRSRGHLDEEDAALLEDIVTEANHMSNLATNLLTLARLDNRSSHREHEVVNLAHVAAEGAQRVQALADQTELSVQVEADEPAVVIGDPALLEQAVLALLDNAIKYNRRGGHITIRTATEEGQALLEVSDTGIGIATEHLAHLGERFYRVDKARSREAGGTGLGLSITRGIAIAHNGSLSLTSIPDQGTTVTLTLPLAQGTSPDRLHGASENVLSLPEQTM